MLEKCCIKTIYIKFKKNSNFNSFENHVDDQMFFVSLVKKQAVLWWKYDNNKFGFKYWFYGLGMIFYFIYLGRKPFDDQKWCLSYKRLTILVFKCAFWFWMRCRGMGQNDGVRLTGNETGLAKNSTIKASTLQHLCYNNNSLANY